MLIFVVSSKETALHLLLLTLLGAVLYILQKIAKTEMISTRLDNSNKILPCTPGKKGDRGEGKRVDWGGGGAGLTGEGLEGLNGGRGGAGGGGEGVKGKRVTHNM